LKLKAVYYFYMVTLSTETLPTLDELIKKAGDLQMMPQTARKVMELVSKESTTAIDLASVIEKDANITTRILKISNSAFYGLRQEIKTVQHAIVILGYKSVRSLVVASSSKAVHKRFGITEQLMWDGSVGTAIFARLLAKGKRPAVGELAFVGGLLHNVGKAIMNNECPKAYTEVMKNVYNTGTTFAEAEKKVFKYSHPEVGYGVITRWGLPENISKIIRFHQLSRLDPNAKEEVLKADEDLRTALACVEVAVELCRLLGVGYKDRVPDVKLDALEGSKILGLDSAKLDQIVPICEKSFLEEKAIFN